MSLDTRGVQIANGSKNPDDARIKDLENLTLILTKAHHNALLRAPWILLDVLQDFFLYLSLIHI